MQVQHLTFRWFRYS